MCPSLIHHSDPRSSFHHCFTSCDSHQPHPPLLLLLVLSFERGESSCRHRTANGPVVCDSPLKSVVVVVVMCWAVHGLAVITSIILFAVFPPAWHVAAVGPTACYPRVNDAALAVNGPTLDWHNDAWSERFRMTGGDLFMTPLTIVDAMLASSIRLFPTNNTGPLTVRAALYDYQSLLLVQTELVTVTSGPTLTQIDLKLVRDLVLTPGRYGVGVWFAPRPGAGASWGVNLTFTTPSSMYYRSVPTSESFDRTNGSFPVLLAPWNKWGWRTVPLASLVHVVGLACATHLPAEPISLNASLFNVLEQLRAKAGGRPPGMGAGLIHLPTPLSNLTNSRVADNAVCPFILAASAVSGVRRADALVPEPIQLTDRWQLTNYSFVVTAVLVHQAIELGMLKLTTTVGDVLPYLPRTTSATGGLQGDCGCGSSQGYFAQSRYACGARIYPNWMNVTVAHLLTQVSSLVTLDSTMTRELSTLRDMERSGEAEECTGYAVPSRRYLITKLLALSVPRPPLSPDEPTPNGDYMGASSLNGLVLAVMLEEIYGREWERLASALFQRLHMDSAGFGPLSPAVPLNQTADDVYGHSYGARRHD